MSIKLMNFDFRIGFSLKFYCFLIPRLTDSGTKPCIQNANFPINLEILEWVLVVMEYFILFLLGKNPIPFSILLRKKSVLKLVQADPDIGHKAGKMK